MVIAVDFDGTLCSDRYPEVGEPNLTLIKSLTQLQKEGHSIVLWTSRFGDKLAEAVSFCSKMGLKLDAVNDRPDPDPDRDSSLYPGVPSLSRYQKVFADIYIDDRAITPENFVLVRRIFEKSIDKN